MGSKATRSIEGFESLGGEVPFLNPHAIKIVGLDIPEAADNWHAYCPRAKEPLEPEWIADIRENGVRTPVDVYRDGNTTVMLEGRRRVRAARIVWDEQKEARVPIKERIKVRCTIRQGKPEELFTYNIGSENRKQRSPMQRASLMLHAQKYGLDDDTLAAKFRVTKQVVKYTLALFDLAIDVQRAVDGGFPLKEAIKLKDKPREEQRKILAALVSAGATKGEAVKEGIARARRGEVVSKDQPLRPVPAAARSRVVVSLSNGAMEKLSEANKEVARIVAGTARWLSGDCSALDGWPEVAAIVKKALDKPEKAEPTR